VIAAALFWLVVFVWLFRRALRQERQDGRTPTVG
jgi:hypothetical protein